MGKTELQTEIDRLTEEFQGANENKMRVMEGLIEQAAYERIYLRRMNEQALVSGLVKMKPGDPTKQKTLPVSSEISKHSAALTNIMDKLIKHLGADFDDDDDDDGLSDYE